MAKFTLPPNKLTGKDPAKKAAAVMNEKKVSAIINKGGSTTRKEPDQPDELKNFNIKILNSELQAINELREKMPRPRGKRLSISLHDWIVSAIQEKIIRDGKK